MNAIANQSKAGRMQIQAILIVDITNQRERVNWVTSRLQALDLALAFGVHAEERK